MKRVIDVKSLIIGVLSTALLFTIIGAKSKNSANFDTITAKEVKIVNSKGKVVADLASVEGEGELSIFNKKRKPVAELSGFGGEGTLIIGNKEGKPVAGLDSNKGRGALIIGNKEGKVVATLASVKGKGQLNIYNKYGNRVATLQSNEENYGAIGLFDRYGDPGWAMTGKK